MLFSFLFNVSIYFIACTGGTDSADPNVGRVPPPDFIKEIPFNKKGEIDWHYQIIKKDAVRLKLESLDIGYDSLQIRIWLGHSMAIVKHVIGLKRTMGKWKGELIEYTEGYTDHNGKIVAEKSNSKRVKPLSGWEKFKNDLFDLQILTLPNADNLKGYNGGGADGISYDVEIATTKKYRFYSYGNPKGYVNEYWQAANILKIALLLEKEFGFKYVR